MKLNFKWLTVVFAGLLCLAANTVHAQAVSPQRANDLYVEFDRTQTCPNCNHGIPRLNVYGWRGQPYREKPENKCRCGKRSDLTFYNAYHHWHSPLSVLLDHGRHGDKWRKGTETTHPRFRDKLDVFSNVRLAPPVRKDNGYCGKHCDPYGLVGRSRQGVVLAAGQPTSESNAHANITQRPNSASLKEVTR